MSGIGTSLVFSLVSGHGSFAISYLYYFLSFGLLNSLELCYKVFYYITYCLVEMHHRIRRKSAVE